MQSPCKEGSIGRAPVETMKLSANRVVVWLCVLLLSGLCLGDTLGAGTLPLPDDAAVIIDQIADQCDSCLGEGFSPSGNADIGFGNKFFANFFMGQPSRGILVSYIMDAESYLAILRSNDREMAEARVKEAFARTRLFVVRQQQYRVTAVLSPTSIEVRLPARLHACLRGTSKPLCCCCTDCASECCEKSLGSTAVVLHWIDPMRPDRSIVYSWSPHAGDSIIRTLAADGKAIAIRWCLDASGPGFLKRKPRADRR